MIKSMTGFGRCETAENNRKFTVEMKSVNHRYLDVNIKMPKKLNFFESAIRSELKNYISRGKVDLFITYEDFSENTSSVRYNKELAAEYLGYLKQMASDFDLDCDIRVSTLSKYPDVFVMEEQDIDEEELWKELQRALKGACEMFVQTRITEGEHLRDDLIAKLDGMLKLVDFITERSPQIIAEYRQRLEERVKELLGDTTVDEGRLLTEVTIFADTHMVMNTVATVTGTPIFSRNPATPEEKMEKGVPSGFVPFTATAPTTTSATTPSRLSTIMAP